MTTRRDDSAPGVRGSARNRSAEAEGWERRSSVLEVTMEGMEEAWS